MIFHGVIFVVSLFWLSLVICGLYTLSQAPFAPWPVLLRGTILRGLKLVAVLGSLGITVHFLSL
jgi:hypothetical protein